MRPFFQKILPFEMFPEACSHVYDMNLISDPT
jgi:hypothetical protein